jgi:phosphomannomutase
VQNFLSVGQAFGEFIQGETCIVGRDTRRTGEMATNAVISGLLSRGCKVIDLGITSTPAVFREVKVRGSAGGVSITSSHNPPEWNGAKFIVKPGRGVFEDELERIQQLMSDEGSFKIGKYFHAQPSYARDITAFVGEDTCKGVKVALDLGGGATCGFLPHVLEKLGAKVLSLNSSAGIFSRTIDPTADALKELSIAVRSNKCDVGFAYDCDGDRLVIMNREGMKLPADYTLLFGLRFVAETEGLSKACISVDTSLAVVNYLNSINARIYRAKVGESNVLRKMVEEDCTSGGEGSSGGFIYAPMNMCRDGLLISAMVLRLITEHGSLKKVCEGIEEFRQERRKVACSRVDAPKVMDALTKKVPDAQTIDGIGISPSEDSWVLIRPSNTEDVMRLSVEAKTAAKVKEIVEKYEKMIASAIKEAG